MEILDVCMQPGFLKVIYYLNLGLNIIKFVIPLLLIVKITVDLFKGILDPQVKEDWQKIRKRIIVAIIIFLIPSIVTLVMNIIEKSIGVETYNGFTECYFFANMEYIKLLEENIKEDELQKYLTERERNLEKAAQYKLAYQKIVESRQIKQVGQYANRGKKIVCGSGSKYNNGLFNAVRAAGYKTREGVVAAALYLSSYIDVNIPYFWSGGHYHTYSGYQDFGNNFIGISDKWGCNVKMISSGTSMQKPGNQYPFGLDCSGFVSWAILNGGYYTGDEKQTVYISTKENPSTSIDGIKINVVNSKNAKDKIKPGDIAHKNGHIGMVVEVSNNSYKVAEEQSFKTGLIIKEYKYGQGFTSVILMDNFYNNYQKGKELWNGFK